MTREEAIKLVKRIKGAMVYTEEEKEALETLILELVESEDWRIKNKSGYYKAGKFWKASTLWNAVKDKSSQRVPNRYILQECTWNIGTLQRFANEVKNVQEVSLDYPIILDMNGNILDGAHRVVKAYLEGKDIDIVYLGDDEWPEPDYDEEKAVKESEDERIRKELIETINCMKEDHQVFLSEQQIERYLAWLEKQGKCDIDCPQKHQDNIQPNGCIVLEDFNGGEGFYKLNLDYLNKKQVEEVEEMVRTWNKESKASNENIKACIGMCLTDANEQRFKDYNTTLKDCLAWLEKQKERDLDIVPELRPTAWGEGYQHGCKDTEEKYSGMMVCSPKEWDEAISDAFKHGMDEGKKQKEQKPWSEEDEKILNEIITIMEGGKVTSGTYLSEYAYWLKSLRPQPKAELTLLDENIINAAVAFVEQNNHFNYWGGIDKRTVIKALRSLKPSWKPTEEQKYDGNMDNECIKLCDVLNSIPSIDTFESCCGHLKDRYSVWFLCNDIVTISRLGRCVERNYSDGKWELVADSTDTHPTGVFWLRSKAPFQDYDEMEESVNELCVGIQYWFNAKFDSYFNGGSCK